MLVFLNLHDVEDEGLPFVDERHKGLFVQVAISCLVPDVGLDCLLLDGKLESGRSCVKVARPDVIVVVQRVLLLVVYPCDLVHVCIVYC